MVAQVVRYPARLEIDHPEELNRLTTLLRPIWAIPVMVLAMAINSSLTMATLLMIVFRLRYPRWFFDFSLELTRFSTRLGAYLMLLTDQYPSSEDEQSVHLELDYPDAPRDLNRWLPLVKWILLLPHYIVLAVLFVGAFFAVLVAWFAILFTGRYPGGLFDFVVGVNRWGLRVNAYGFLLTTDQYPPFSLR